MWYYVLSFNLGGHGTVSYPALQDPVVRKAIAYAIDKQQLVDIARLSYGTVLEDFMSPEFFGPAYEDPDAVRYEYNVFLANQLLDAAGYLDIDADGIREMPAPAPDSDGDGIPDNLDACPDIAGLPEYGGCPGEVETLEELETRIDELSTSVGDANSNVAELAAEVQALQSQLTNSLNMAYGLAAVAIVIAIIAAYYAMRS
jgi:ABC-type transport system substrate-binding protein